MIKAAVVEMEKNGIYQWDDLYPMREDFLADLSAGHLFVGVENGEPCVVYVVNKECDEEYNHAAWKYPESEYRVIHRLCVNPAVQNRGIAKKYSCFTTLPCVRSRTIVLLLLLLICQTLSLYPSSRISGLRKHLRIVLNAQA